MVDLPKFAIAARKMSEWCLRTSLSISRKTLNKDSGMFGDDVQQLISGHDDPKQAQQLSGVMYY